MSASVKPREPTQKVVELLLGFKEPVEKSRQERELAVRAPRDGFSGRGQGRTGGSVEKLIAVTFNKPCRLEGEWRRTLDTLPILDVLDRAIDLARKAAVLDGTQAAIDTQMS